MPNSNDPEKRAEQAAAKEERVKDRAVAMQEYEAGKLAMRENMLRLRKLRLAKEADYQAPKSPKARKPKTVKFNG